MSQWSSLFAEKGFRVSKLMGIYWGRSCLRFSWLWAGRCTALRHKINLKNALLLCGVLCVVCYGGYRFVVTASIVLGGLRCLRLWRQPAVAGTLSVTARGIPKGGTAMFGLLAVAGDMGCALGPFLTGQVSGFSQSLPAAAEISRVSELPWNSSA